MVIPEWNKQQRRVATIWQSGGPQTITASEALEEALCFGWIDGQMQNIDDKTYQKYFSQRR
jgi:uncharacterized protein YdeI (YjbR/CyaY-like superfamily)